MINLLLLLQEKLKKLKRRRKIEKITNKRNQIKKEILAQKMILKS